MILMLLAAPTYHSFIVFRHKICILRNQKKIISAQNAMTCSFLYLSFLRFAASIFFQRIESPVVIDDFKSLFLVRLAQLLDATGIAERERTAWLRDLLGIDLSSANRKLKGGIAFNIEELAKVAKPSIVRRTICSA